VRFLPCAKQREKAAETLRVVAPLAHRLGMAKIGRELEEIAAATLYEGPAQPSVPADLRVTRRMLEVAAMLLPAAVRGRWLEEWMGELHTLPARGRVRFTAQLLCGMPRLAAALHRSSVRTATDGSPAGLGAGRGSGGLFRTKVGVLRLLRWVLVSDARTWSLLLPFVVWMAIETGRDNAGDALVCLITVPPVLVAGVEWLRGRLDASPATHRENRENS
jgi:hypothetical protein